jgi:hypothetical protein
MEGRDVEDYYIFTEKNNNNSIIFLVENKCDIDFIFDNEYYEKAYFNLRTQPDNYDINIHDYEIYEF